MATRPGPRWGLAGRGRIHSGYRTAPHRAAPPPGRSRIPLSVSGSRHRSLVVQDGYKSLSPGFPVGPCGNDEGAYRAVRRRVSAGRSVPSRVLPRRARVAYGSGPQSGFAASKQSSTTPLAHPGGLRHSERGGAGAALPEPTTSAVGLPLDPLGQLPCASAQSSYCPLSAPLPYERRSKAGGSGETSRSKRHLSEPPGVHGLIRCLDVLIGGQGQGRVGSTDVRAVPDLPYEPWLSTMCALAAGPRPCAALDVHPITLGESLSTSCRSAAEDRT
jgi:hypothetical protein